MKVSKLPISVKVISDGTLNKMHQWILKLLTYILFEDHSKRVEVVINNFPNTKRLYKDFILMKKIVDLKVDAGPSTPIVYFDSDVLFTKNVLRSINIFMYGFDCSCFF